jgi:hypothetical protein
MVGRAPGAGAGRGERQAARARAARRRHAGGAPPACGRRAGQRRSALDERRGGSGGVVVQPGAPRVVQGRRGGAAAPGEGRGARRASPAPAPGRAVQQMLRTGEALHSRQAPAAVMRPAGGRGSEEWRAKNLGVGYGHGGRPGGRMGRAAPAAKRAAHDGRGAPTREGQRPRGNKCFERGAMLGRAAPGAGAGGCGGSHGGLGAGGRDGAHRGARGAPGGALRAGWGSTGAAPPARRCAGGDPGGFEEGAERGRGVPWWGGWRVGPRVRARQYGRAGRVPARRSATAAAGSHLLPLRLREPGVQLGGRGAAEQPARGRRPRARPGGRLRAGRGRRRRGARGQEV